MTATTYYTLDNEGYLIDPEDWTEAVADILAEHEGIALTAEHRQVLQFMRVYWSEHRIAPDVRHVIDQLARTQGIGKTLAKERLFKLFPYGYVLQACRIAGMRRPRAWSTG
ncbi:MAG: TusE/DsrC/DsvC family sulfur relay protein [Thiotrichales bacterium]